MSARGNQQMDISVILCTYNRCEMLAHTLESVAASVVPSHLEWEVVVVDNNSNDYTRDVVDDFSHKHPGRFRCVWEVQQGLCYARNAGISAALGKVVVFTDDDVSVDANWLWNLTSGLLGSEWAGAGGRILPLWMCPIPRWFSMEGRRAMAPFAVFDLGPEAGPLHEPPVGANMAFRRVMFEKYGSFRTDLDRCGTGMLSNGDTEFGRRLLASGKRLRYEPSAVVNHPVSPNRLQKQYLLNWEFGKGRADIREAGVDAGTKWFAVGIPFYLLRRFLRWTLQWIVTMDPRRRFACKRSVWDLAGEIAECYQQAHGAKGLCSSSAEIREHSAI
jgi:glycosyltransferase involved in cell wall biosynthesis